MGFLLFIVIVLVLILVSGIRIVSQSKAQVIERLGAYHRTNHTGLQYVVPFFERVSNTVSLKEIVKDFAPQPVITKDNVTMQIDTVVYFHITDPKMYTYGVENPVSAIENLTATTLRNIIGELELDETLTSRDVINTKMRSILDVATDPWGIKVTRVEVKNIIPPRDIQEAMEKQMRAERERREAILKAEGEKKAAILIAEGEKESAILRADALRETHIREAEGEAAAIIKIQEATAEGLRLLKSAHMDEAVLKYKSYEAMTQVANGNATKIIVPSELQNFATAGMVFGEMISPKVPPVLPTPKMAPVPGEKPMPPKPAEVKPRPVSPKVQ
ncbi:MAG: SPFH domain-containing protein [Mycoplasmatota bacterium]|nr:SPFH domain-containing protein [Mycoplasmatota bacterium]